MPLQPFLFCSMGRFATAPTVAALSTALANGGACTSTGFGKSSLKTPAQIMVSWFNENSQPSLFGIKVYASVNGGPQSLVATLTEGGSGLQQSTTYTYPFAAGGTVGISVPTFTFTINVYSLTAGSVVFSKTVTYSGTSFGSCS